MTQRCAYQIENVQVIFKHKALHGPLEICKYSQSLGRREGRGKGGSTELGRMVALRCTCEDMRTYNRDCEGRGGQAYSLALL